LVSGCARIDTTATAETAFDGGLLLQAAVDVATHSAHKRMVEKGDARM
jgi:hypothetical protein